MKHIWTVACQNSSIDYESNLISLLNCIEEINFVFDATTSSPETKVMLPAVQLASYWLVGEGDDSLELKTEFLDFESKLINSFESQFPVKKGLSRFRNRTNIQGISINKGGRYYFRVSIKAAKGYIEVTEIPLDINISYKVASQITNK